ncbi:NAD-dependent epimerase/dehydratase family protein [Phycisphaerales bacterium AB-hyl4]|uniref:NAD-dependent epimerase/dehydratase family protein n=1 Tax=Natronomicrosphaera hydrolytica TaxID=3242702 RepID=A0ABV4UAF1_9BACT
MDSHVLVTGGAGFIGSHLTEALLELGASVTVLDDLSGSDMNNLALSRQQAGQRLRFVEGSVCDTSTVARCVEGARYVFHLAARGSVPQSVKQPVQYHEVNSTGTLNVLEAARSAGVKRVIFAASSSAYGDAPALPKVESMAVRPGSPYAATKVAGEALLRAYASSYGFDTVSLRYFNIFGPRQNANSAYAAVIAAFANALLAGERLRIFGDGEQSRDFTYVANAVHANLLAARATTPLQGEVFNVASGRRISVNQLADLMARQMGRPDLTPEHLPERAGDVKHSLADLTQATTTLGYQPQVTFEQGLAWTVAWYQHTANVA